MFWFYVLYIVYIFHFNTSDYRRQRQLGDGSHEPITGIRMVNPGHGISLLVPVAVLAAFTTPQILISNFYS